MKHALLLLCAALSAAWATSDTARGLVGSTLCFRKKLDVSDSSCAVTLRLRLSNPTVWYPQRATSDTTTLQLRRANDTTWFLEGVLSAAARYVELCGIVLAGSDSVCVVQLDSASACLQLSDSVQVLLVSSIGAPLPYVRFARLEGPFPLPALCGDGRVVVYVAVDATTDVTLRLFDVLGRLHVARTQRLPHGVHRIELELPPTCTPGVYVLRLETTTGNDGAVFVVE